MTEERRCGTCRHWDNVSWSDEPADCLAIVPEWVYNFSEEEQRKAKKSRPNDGEFCLLWEARDATT